MQKAILEIIKKEMPEVIQQVLIRRMILWMSKKMKNYHFNDW